MRMADAGHPCGRPPSRSQLLAGLCLDFGWSRRQWTSINESLFGPLRKSPEFGTLHDSMVGPARFLCIGTLVVGVALSTGDLYFQPGYIATFADSHAPTGVATDIG